MKDQKTLRYPFQLTKAQSVTLNKIPRCQILEQLNNGDVVVVSELSSHIWKVVPANGNTLAFDKYLSLVG